MKFSQVKTVEFIPQVSPQTADDKIRRIPICNETNEATEWFMSSISSVFMPANYRRPIEEDSGPANNDLKSIGTALSYGNLSLAQNALHTLEQSWSARSISDGVQPFGRNMNANANYQNLTRAIQSGDLSAAQQAFTNLESALKNHKVDEQSGSSAGKASSLSAKDGIALNALA